MRSHTLGLCYRFSKTKWGLWFREPSAKAVVFTSSWGNRRSAMSKRFGLLVLGSLALSTLGVSGLGLRVFVEATRLLTPMTFSNVTSALIRSYHSVYSVSYYYCHH